MTADSSSSELEVKSPESGIIDNHGNGKESSSTAPNEALFSGASAKPGASLSTLRENLFMIFITLTQLVQMIPLGAGINSGLAIGESLGATHIQSVWIVASYPLTQGAFVLIGKYARVSSVRRNLFHD
jgi:hypothetical protein